MKTAIGLLAVVLTLAGAPPSGAAAASPSPATTRGTTADELKAKLDRGEKVLVIDVRTDEEARSGSIPGAIHIPEDQLQARMKDVPKDVQVVFT